MQGGYDFIRVLARDRVDRRFHELLRDNPIVAMQDYRLSEEESKTITEYVGLVAPAKRGAVSE